MLAMVANDNAGFLTLRGTSWVHREHARSYNGLPATTHQTKQWTQWKTPTCKR